jgi:hypothetical protein
VVRFHPGPPRIQNSSTTKKRRLSKAGVFVSSPQSGRPAHFRRQAIFRTSGSDIVDANLPQTTSLRSARNAQFGGQSATALATARHYCQVVANELQGRLAAIVDFTLTLRAGHSGKRRIGMS